MTFYNIFSSAKEKTKEKVKIIVDYREKNSLLPSELIKTGLDIEFKQLPVADYLVNNIAIERKTLSDLKASIIDRRIFTQIPELQQYSRHILIVEDKKENYQININENALRGFIIAALMDYNLPIIFTKDERETAKYIELLSRKRESKEISINPKKISLNKEEQVQYILEGFPNIGPVKAKKLIEKFKSLKNITNAKEEDLKDILMGKTKDFLRLVDDLY